MRLSSKNEWISKRKEEKYCLHNDDGDDDDDIIKFTSVHNINTQKGVDGISNGMRSTTAYH